VRTRTSALLAPRTSARLQFTAAIVLPDNLEEASEAQIRTVVAEAAEALKGFRTLANLDEVAMAEARRLAGIVKTGRGALAARAANAAELAGLVEDLGEEAPEAPAAETPKVEEPKVEAAVEAPKAEVKVEAAKVEAPKASEVLAAGGGDEAPKVEKAATATLAAAPDAVGVGQGHVFANFDEAARSVLARTSGYPTGATATASRFQHGALQVKRTFAPELVAKGYEDDEVIERAASFDRIGGQQSLLAAGGWVAASETVYDLLEYEGVDGMIDLPEVQTHRGGLRFTKGPDYSGFRGQGFNQTETQAIAGTAKPFYTVPGTNFVEVRAGITGLGVTSGLLVQKAYPELVSRVLRGLLVAHTHDLNKKTIADLETDSTAVTVNLGPGATVKLLSSIELQVLDIRTKYAMTDNTVLEMVIPSWTIGLLRQDLAFRKNWNVENIPDAAITKHFADRGVRVQWVKDWQDSWIGQVATPATAWPANVKYLIYPAGTWVRGMDGVISIETLYDSAGLGVNNYTALFTEESYLVVKRGFESRVITVPVVADGSTPSIELTKTVA
jgi:hypothetical protein